MTQEEIIEKGFKDMLKSQKEMTEACNGILKLMTEFKKEMNKKVDLLDIKLSK